MGDGNTSPVTGTLETNALQGHRISGFSNVAVESGDGALPSLPTGPALPASNMNLNNVVHKNNYNADGYQIPVDPKLMISINSDEYAVPEVNVTPGRNYAMEAGYDEVELQGISKKNNFQSVRHVDEGV